MTHAEKSESRETTEQRVADLLEKTYERAGLPRANHDEIARYVGDIFREQVAREIEADEAAVSGSGIGLGMRRSAWIARGAIGQFGGSL